MADNEFASYCMLFKSFFLLLFLFLSTVIFAQRTDFRVAAYAGLPVGNSTPLYKYQAGIDGVYLPEMSRTFSLGFMLGVSYATGNYYQHRLDDVVERFQVKDLILVPVAASLRYRPGSFYVGTDLGYAISATGKKSLLPTGGVYFRPRIGLDFDWLSVFFSATNVFSKSHNPYDSSKIAGANGFHSLNLGVEYKF